jgi:hypothetical protein
VNLKAFFVDVLSSALDGGVATADDILRHVTPDVLATHLPRPLWARLLTACIGAPKVSSQLVVDTIGVPNLCEHVPSVLIWGCVSEIAQRALGGAIPEPIVPRAAAATPARPLPLATPPPELIAAAPAPTAVTPTGSGRTGLPSLFDRGIPPAAPDPVGDVVATLDAEDRAAPARSRTITGQRFRQSGTGIGRLANPPINARRPQAQAPAPAAAAPTARRGQTDTDALDLETDIKDDWKNALAVEDEQLVEWQASDETLTVTEDTGRKR